MAVELKNSEFGNIMHCLANEKMFSFAKDLIENIRKNYGAKDVVKLMSLRNSIAENSPMMVMINKISKLDSSKMSMLDSNLYNEEKENIISIWNMMVNDEVFDVDILSPNKQKQTILHLCIQSNMFEFFKMICRSNYVFNVFDIFNDPISTPLIQIFNEDFLTEVLIEHSKKKFCLETRKIVLWHICKQNFNNAFHCIKESMPRDEFLVIINLTDNDENNSSMIAAKEASDMWCDCKIISLAKDFRFINFSGDKVPSFGVSYL